MAKKETVSLTFEALHLTTVLHYSTLKEINGFYEKEVFFSPFFSGNVSLLFQALGNLGAFARNEDLNKDIDIVIISNSIINQFEVEPLLPDPFITELENKLNQNNSPYRRIKILSEDHLIWYLENRIKTSNDEVTKKYLDLYKQSRKGDNIQGEIFD